MRMPSFWHLKTCPEATQTERVGMKALSSIEHMILVDIDPLKNTNFFPKNTIIQITSWTILTQKDLSYSQKRTFHINLMIMASICTLSICQKYLQEKPQEVQSSSKTDYGIRKHQHFIWILEVGEKKQIIYKASY
jgi:hypothetical protein